MCGCAWWCCGTGAAGGLIITVQHVDDVRCVWGGYQGQQAEHPHAEWDVSKRKPEKTACSSSCQVIGGARSVMSDGMLVYITGSEGPAQRRPGKSSYLHIQPSSCNFTQFVWKKVQSQKGQSHPTGQLQPLQIRVPPSLLAPLKHVRKSLVKDLLSTSSSSQCLKHCQRLLGALGFVLWVCPLGKLPLGLWDLLYSPLTLFLFL